MNRSTLFMLLAFAISQPILWTKHPLATLGEPLFYTLAISMMFLFAVGIGLWASGDDDK